MYKKINVLLISLLAVSLYSAEGTEDKKESVFDEVVVTAQRVEQSLQDVPISVSAFSAAQIDEQQIETGGDLQVVVPSLTFVKDGARGGQFGIRGISNGATSNTADTGVEVHMNSLPMGSTTMQDGEFFDMQRIEVLRGPQGTLFGKNSVAGAINLITNKADSAEFTSDIGLDLHQYNGQRVKGHVNLPLNDSLAVRVAYLGYERDGYVNNIYSQGLDDDIDGRNSESMRMSIGWENNTTRIDLVREKYDESSSRSLGNNTYCKRDSSLVNGCTPGGERAYELTHPMGTYVENIMAAFGFITFTPDTDMSGAPQGFFEVNYLGLPEYNLNQETSQFLIEHQLTDDLVINAGAHHKDRSMNRVSGYSSPEMQTFRFNDTSMMFPWGFKGVPQSGYGTNCNIDDGTAGLYGGCFKDDGVILDYPTGFNANNFQEDMDVAEIRLTSSYDGKYNFMVGALTSKTEGEYTYDVIATGLEALSLTYSNPIFRALTGSTAGSYPSMFQTGDRSISESQAFFGELYIQQSDDLRITLGLRQTDDDKSSYTRQAFLDTTGVGGIGTGFTADPGSSGIPGFGEAFVATTGKQPVMDFSKTTGRLVVDYFVSEDMMVYGSLSTGFKGGGFNPAIDPLVFPDTKQTFDPMTIDAIEVGFKSEFPEQGVRLNASAYAYDIEGYHTTTIVNKTSLNDGVDVKIEGLEADVLWIPQNNPNWTVNLGYSFTQSEIGDSSQIDPLNADLQLTGGPDSANWHYMKTFDSEIFITRKDAATAIYNLWASGALVGTPLQGVLVPTEFHGDRIYGADTPVSFGTPAAGHLPSFIMSMPGYQAMAGMLGFNPAEVIKSGLPTDLSGNSLLHPDHTLTIGGQYVMNAGPIDVTFRLDGYYRSKRFTRIFNLPYDEIPGWHEYNAQITLTPADVDDWFVQIYGQNITNAENIESLGLGSAAVGFTRGINAREPRVWGMRFGMKF